MENFYKDENGTIYDEQSDILPSWVKMTEEEVREFLNPTKSIEQVKSEKLSEIKLAFSNEQESGHTTSSLGFEVDATRRSKDDIESLLYVGEFPVLFRDYDNDFHELSKEQAEILKREIIAYGLYVYQKKWTLQQTVENATTVEDVEAVVWEM